MGVVVGCLRRIICGEFGGWKGLEGGGDERLLSGIAAREDNPAEYTDMVVFVYNGYGGIPSPCKWVGREVSSTGRNIA